MEVYGEVEEQFHLISASIIIGGEWSSSRSGRLALVNRAPGRLGGRQNQSEEEKRLFLVGIEPRFFDCPVRSLDQRFSNCGTTAVVSSFASLLININKDIYRVFTK
jgi:hypothetical protein